MALDIAADKRMKFIGGFLDVNDEITEKMICFCGQEYKDEKKEYESKGTEYEYNNSVECDKNTIDGRTISENTSDTQELNAECCLKEMRIKMMKGLSYSKQQEMDLSNTLKFWRSPETRNRKFIDDTDPSFFVTSNENTNLLTDEEFYAYLGIFLGMCFLNHEMISVKFADAFWENLMS